MRRTFRIVLVLLVAAALWSLWPGATRRQPPTPPIPSEQVEPPPDVPAATPGRPSSGGESTYQAGPTVEFAEWSKRFTDTPSVTRDQMVEQGVTLAATRRAFLENLIKTNPKAALEQAVPDDVRRRLPPEIQQQLEERVSGRGFFGVLVANYPDEQRREVTREVILNGRRFDAYVYGRRESQTTREKETLWGIAIGSSLAVHELPVRALSAAESAGIDPTGNCPVSGLDANTHGTPALAEVAGHLEKFCGAGHLASISQRLAADGGIGNEGEEPPIAHDGWTQGPRRVLFMRVTYPDDPTEAITEAAAYALMDATSAWFAETSYNTTWLVTDVTPLMLLPQPKAWYCENGDGNILSDAREIARSYGYDTDNYNLDIVRFPNPGGGCNGYGYGGKAYVRGKGCWMLSNSTGVMIHELGHNYGVWHANFWTGLGDGIASHGSHVEYGNPYDVMGSSGSQGQFNAAFKNILDWMQDFNVQTVTTSGTYRVFTFDVASLTPGQNYALKIRKDYDRNYWAEFRRKYANQWFLNGVMLNWDAWNNGVTNSGSGTHLLDTTPGTPSGGSGKDDSAVVIGRTYSDVPSSIHITPVARGDGSLPENWIDLVVNLGIFPSNNAPTNLLIADRTSVATGAVVNFTAVAGDPDGDALAYAWDFGDLSFGPNAPFATKSWGTTGEYVVRCTVSDMKGGLSTKTILVTVGSPTTFRASGRVTASGVPLEGVRIHNGLSGSSYRGTYTDSDGYYRLPGLAAGNHNLTAMDYGYTVTAAGWSNPIAVGPHAANLNFNAAPLPAIGFSQLDTNLGEAGLNPGVVRITRRGDTNPAVSVRLNRTGSASFNTDYTMNPSPSNSPLQFALAPGVTNLDITLTPVGDSTTEGPEFITLTLIENASYVLASSAEVTLVLADDEAYARPTVTVSASNSGGPTADNVATESGNDPGVFLLTRSGNVANELLVQYSISGSATAGTDYTALSGVASIPAGQNTASVTFRTLDDAEVENNETVILTLRTNAAYALNASSNATVTILDDDPVTVTVVASDNIASETSGNSGAVIFNRVGSFAANLVVNYSLTGSASNGVDYTSLSGTITIPAGRPSVSLTISPINDTAVEGDETVIVSVASSATYNVGNPGGAMVVIQDNEISTVTLSAVDSTASEPGANTGAFRFARTAPTTNELTVIYRVTGEAVPGADYLALSGSLTFAIGVATNDVVVVPLDDAFTEAAERVLVSILPNPDYVVSNAAPVAVTISANNAPGGSAAIGFSTPASERPESDTSATISLRLSTNLPSNASVNYAVTGGTATGGGTDYTLASGILVFPTNEVNRTISFSVANDTAGEANETIVITLSNSTNAVLDVLSSHTFIIVDDDVSGALTVSTPDTTANEAGLGTATFRISRSTTTAAPQTVYLQVLGSANAPADYAALPTEVTIPAGVSFVDLLITPFDDATDETNETVTINLLPSPGARLGSPDLATITIVDDDNANSLPIVRVEATDAWAAEPGADTGTFRISRDRDTNTALTISFIVGGAATSGTDYTNLGTSVTLPIGVWETNLVVWPRNDTGFETNETIVLSLTILAPYRVGPLAAVATVTLVDDEQGVSVTGSGVSAEDLSSTGSFVIRRTGTTVSNLTVLFRWAGTAATNDFSPFTTNVVIPAGTNSITRTIVAVNDAISEGIESLVLTLATNAAYTVLSQSTAGITLMDAGVPSYWNQWRAANFTLAELAQPLISGPDADPDGDGRRNLMEYACNRPPKLADPGNDIAGSLEVLPPPPGQSEFVARFTRRLTPTDLLYEVEVSDNFAAWEGGPALAVELPAINDGNGVTETARFEIPPGPGTPAQRFVKLKVTLLSPP